MTSKQQSADCAADGRVERENNKVSLIVKSDTRRREEAVMITLQHTAVTDLAVMRTRRRHQQTHGTRLKLGNLLMMMTFMVLAVFTRGLHQVASVESSLYSSTSRL